MNLFKKILVPVDFSDCAINSLKEAASLAKKYDGEIALINVLNIATTPASQMKEAEVAVKEQLEELAKKHEIKISELIVKQGLPGEEIARVIEDGEFTLCVMGTHSRHDVISELVGTVALKVMQLSKIPLIIIPGGLHLNEIDKVVFATDYKKIKDSSILKHLHDLCTASNANLQLLHIADKSGKVTEKEIYEALNLHEYFFDIDHKFFLSTEKDVVKGIINHMKEKNADLLAVMPRKHKFFEFLFNETLTERLGIHLSVPLFSFHE